MNFWHSISVVFFSIYDWRALFSEIDTPITRILSGKTDRWNTM